MTRCEAGFTLVEVLVVLVAGSLLLVSLSWVLQGSAKDFREAVLADEQVPSSAGLETLALLVESALPVREGDARSGSSGSGAAYVVPTPAALGVAGPSRVELTVRRAGDGQELVARFSPTADSSSNFAPVEAVLLTGLSNIELDVVQGSNPRVPAPLRVKLQQNGEVQTFVARPRVTADGACRFDPISLTCRQ